jgi:hypothetical protein
MLVPLLISRSFVACVLSAGIAAIIFHMLPHQLGLIVAALCGVATGMLAERWYPSPSPVLDLEAPILEEQEVHTVYQGANKP